MKEMKKYPKFVKCGEIVKIGVGISIFQSMGSRRNCKILL